MSPSSVSYSDAILAQPLTVPPERFLQALPWAVAALSLPAFLGGAFLPSHLALKVGLTGFLGLMLFLGLYAWVGNTVGRRHVANRVGTWIAATRPSQELLARLVLSPEEDSDVARTVGEYLDRRDPLWRSNVQRLNSPTGLTLAPAPEGYPLSSWRWAAAALGASLLMLLPAFFDWPKPVILLVLLIAGAAVIAEACATAFVIPRRQKSWCTKHLVSATEACLLQWQAHPDTSSDLRAAIHAELSRRNPSWPQQADVPLWPLLRPQHA